MAKIVSINPATERIYGELDETSASEMRQAIDTANGDASWRHLCAEERAEIVSHLVDILDEHKETLACTMAEEIGRPVTSGRLEVELAKRRVSAYCAQVPGYIASETLYEDELEKNVVLYEPVGAVAVISPWNAPVAVPLSAIVPPLLCGNNIVWKPSEHASFTAMRLQALFERLRPFGLPQAAFRMVLGGKDVGRRLVESDVPMVALTGSVEAGLSVSRGTAGTLRRCVLELGGKDPAIVLEDADVDSAAASIVAAATMYTGQVCFAVERVYCHARIFESFVERCVEQVKKVRVGDPLNERTDMGPFAVRFQMDRVVGQLQDAVDKGATVVCGGQRLGETGYFMTPGVIVGVSHEMKLMREETFGPIVPVMRFEDPEEAVRLANDSIYGLTASVWTKDIEMGEAVAKRIEAGTVAVNRHGMSKPGCPWGGFKMSGIGRLYSKEGTREFTNVKHVWVSGHRAGWRRAEVAEKRAVRRQGA